MQGTRYWHRGGKELVFEGQLEYVLTHLKHFTFDPSFPRSVANLRTHAHGGETHTGSPRASAVPLYSIVKQEGRHLDIDPQGSGYTVPPCTLWSNTGGSPHWSAPPHPFQTPPRQLLSSLNFKYHISRVLFETSMCIGIDGYTYIHKYMHLNIYICKCIYK